MDMMYPMRQRRQQYPGFANAQNQMGGMPLPTTLDEQGQTLPLMAPPGMAQMPANVAAAQNQMGMSPMGLGMMAGPSGSPNLVNPDQGSGMGYGQAFQFGRKPVGLAR